MAKRNRWLFVIAVTALSSSAAAQSSVTLAWNRSTGSNIVGYTLYQGLASRTYNARTVLGNVTNQTVAGLAAGLTYYLAVTAHAAGGPESAFSSEVSYTVPLSNGVPAVVLTSPVDGASFAPPATIPLAATVTANGHIITKVQFYNGTTLLGENALTPYNFTWTNVSAGNYSLTAQAIYDLGSAVSSSAANVTVAAARPGPGLTFAADSGALSGPFLATNGVVYQTVSTGVPDGGRAAYTFLITTPCDYVVSTVVNAPDISANSFYVNIDAEPTDPTMIWDVPLTAGFTNRIVSWRGNGTPDNNQFAPKRFALSAGLHQLIVRGREPNAQLHTITISPAYSKLQIAVLPNKKVLLTGVGRMGYNYEVQATQNLRTWTPIGTVTPVANGSFQFTDAAAPGYRSRSYRLREWAPNSLPPLRISLTPSKQVLLGGTGRSGQLYDVLATQNFATWTTIGTVAADANGMFQFTDVAAFAYRSRAYRLRGAP